MKLEYFDATGSDEAVLLIHSGALWLVDTLRIVLFPLRTAGASVALHEQDFIQAVDGCELTLSSSEGPRGVRSTGPRKFHWNMPPSDWERVHDLLQPFCMPLRMGQERTTHFQYLHDYSGTKVIYSTAREW